MMTVRPRVLRIFRAHVKPGREEEWERLLGKHDHAQFTSTDGLLQWLRGKPLNDESTEYVFVTLWRDWDALRAYAGASAGPVLFGDERELTDSITVEQFEVW